MSEDKGVERVDKPTTESPSENKERKVLKPQVGKLPEDKQIDWNNQPPVVNRDGEPVEEPSEGEPKEPNKELDALGKEKERIAEKREKLLAEIKEGRGENRELQKEAEKQPEQTEELNEQDAWDKVKEFSAKAAQDVLQSEQFYSSKPDFYTGDDGVKNRELIEKFVKVSFKSSNNQARQMAHNQIFGEFEKDKAVRDAKTEQTSKMLKKDAATLGSGTGSTDVGQPAPKKTGRKILTSSDKPSEWYK